LHALAEQIHIKNPSQEFSLLKVSTDAQGVSHIRFQQVYQDIPVFGSEIVVHCPNGIPHSMNGRYFPSPELRQLNPRVSAEEALDQVKTHLAQHSQLVELKEEQKQWIAHEPYKKELVIYHPKNQYEAERLCWHISAIPNLMERWSYFVDAQSGAILHHFSHICNIHGKACAHHTDKSSAKVKRSSSKRHAAPMGKETAQAIDLSGISRTIDVYECNGQYFMVDAAKDMYNGDESDCTNGDRLLIGAIVTFDAFNNTPQSNNFDYDVVSSNNNSWPDRSSVSAHYNASLAYEYFRNAFSRSSINGEGGNIYSFVNVADESGGDMDNAFWNGAAMFYGNGDQAFTAPLAKALDVGGHEMGHGVIQSTANLVYENQPGALNESFADIFGAMIDRDDWTVGEEIANPAIFPTGAMRSLEDPNNGGNSLNDPGWQPKHMDEFVNLPNTPQGDNGGVHINSGIPNHAFYRFATKSGVGKDRAEQVFYKALTDFLGRSSQFVDLRIAAIEASQQLYGNAVAQAAADAFSEVGILGSDPTPTQVDIEVNPGADFVLWSPDDLSSIRNADTQGNDNGAFSNNNHISRPSITDDGSIILYIGADRNIWEIDVDWSTGNILDEYILEQSLDWRNVATSRDGTKFAAVAGDLSNGIFDNEVFVYDFISEQGRWFEFYNPTYTQGISTGDVLFADVLEWDHSGEFLMYDAANEIQSSSGDDITYWDIGFIRVWDNQADTWGDGQVSKLFSGLPENSSVGNPSFSKNSPYIIAYDFIEVDFFGDQTYTVEAGNLETGDIGIIFSGNDLGYPSYSKNDDRVIFHFLQNGQQDIIAVRDLANDKITGTGDAYIFIEDAVWGVWFATGERDLVSSSEPGAAASFSLYPNPFSKDLNLELQANQQGPIEVEVLDLLGRSLWKNSYTVVQGHNKVDLAIDNLPIGNYFVRVAWDNMSAIRKVVRLD
ncbi:MAG: M4 family metallopeptidase, partial [Bacteroidota bacterium]